MRSALLLALALAGCATTPQTIVHTVTVEKPVAVACVRPADVPAEPAKIGHLPDDARNAADVLGRVDIELRSWGRKLGAMLVACGGSSLAP